MTPTDIAGLNTLVDLVTGGGAVGMLVYFVWASKRRVIVWGYQLEEANKRAEKWEALYLDQRDITKDAIGVTAKSTGVQP